MPSGVPLNDTISSHFSVPSPGAVNDKLRAFFDQWYFGEGSPEGVVSAPTGSLYLQKNGTTQVVWQKQSGSGNTGWGALASGTVASLWLGADRFHAVGAGPVEGSTAGRMPAWALDPATDEGVACSLLFPIDWTHVTVTLYSRNSAAGTGNVVFQLGHGTVPADGATPAETLEPAVVMAMPPNTEMQPVELVSDLAITPGVVHTLRVLRDADNPSDSGSTDVQFVGLLLERAPLA